mgnify:CR=1 FL=1
MNLQTFLDAIPSFLWSDGNGAASGLAVTAELFLLSIVPGMALAIAMAVGQVYGPRALALPIRGFTYFFRSTPLYLQLMLIYYGLSQFDIVQTGWMNDQPFWLLFRDATFCATLALVLNTAAYVAELLAGMMVTFPRQEWVAGEAYGMGKWQIIRRLVLPATLRRGIPALNNEMVFLLHATSLASTCLPHSSTRLPNPACGRSVRSTVSMSIDTRPIRRVRWPSTITGVPVGAWRG